MRKQWTKQELIDFESEIGVLYENNQLPFLFHLSGGNEDQLIDIFSQINEGDWVISNHRSHYHALLHGIPPEIVKQRIIDGRSMFIYDNQRKFFVSAIIGGTPAIAAGLAWALKKKGSQNKVWCFIGDGTEDNGHLFEAARYVDGWDLPCNFVIESNNRSVEASNEDRWGTQSNLQWNFDCVTKYEYECSYPHCRKPGMIDLEEALKVKKTDKEYFPPLPDFKYPDLPSRVLEDKPTYKEGVKKSMQKLAERGAIFIGYNVRYGKAMGTLEGVPDDQLVETPVAENLMSGLAIGMSLEGFLPVIYFERHDFMLVAADAIVNHIDKIERISHGEFKVPVIMRAVTADAGPFYSGPTHSQNLTEMFRRAVDFPVICPQDGLGVIWAVDGALASGQPMMLIEKKSLY